MSLDATEMKSAQGETICVPVLITGAGTGTPTKVYGRGVTVSRVSSGLYRLTFADHQGDFMGCTFGHGESAPIAGDARNFTWDNDSYTASGKALDVVCTNPGSDAVAPALDDLESTEQLLIVCWFTRNAD